MVLRLAQGRISIWLGRQHPLAWMFLKWSALVCATAGAQTSKVTQLPLTLPTWVEPVRTSACLQVIERRYAASAWWENAKDSDEPADRAFKEVIVASRRKDRDAMWKLSDPDLGRDAKQFDEQASALFQQFQTMEIVAVPWAYEFDGLVVFYPKFRFQGQTASAPFAFAHRQDGTFGYLPYRIKRLTFELVEDWFHAPWGPDKTEHPTYCSDEDVRQSTHRASLVTSSDGAQASWHPSSLMLRAAPLEAQGALSDLAGQVKGVLDQMKALANRGAMDEFIRHLDAEGAKRTKQWYDTTNDSEREIYKRRWAEQQPFFLFDASPLLVVYAKMPNNTLQVMYFVNSRNDLLWTNSTHITVIDKVFKAGPLTNTALSEKPFSEFAVK